MDRTIRRLIIAILAIVLVGTFTIIFLIGTVAHAAQYSSDFAGVLGIFVDCWKQTIAGLIDLAKLSLGVVP